MVKDTSKLKSISCGICSQTLDTLTLSERQAHYELHFKQESQREVIFNNGSYRPFQIQVLNKVRRKCISGAKENDVFWYPSLASSSPIPSNYTPGIIPLLKRYLSTSHAEGSTCRAALCYPGVVHINREFWDASWGCGYRNFLMACAALMDQPLQPLYFPLLDAPIGPGIRNLQRWIETAWQAGFDRDGAKELKNLVGTNKWIGTSDLWVAFSFRGIPAELVDFNIKDQPQGIQLLTDWVVEYFSPSSQGVTVHDALRNASPVFDTNRMPLILQDDRHSRTIVGYEVSRDGAVKLLMFDPAFVPSRSLRNLALSSASFSSGNLNDQSIYADSASSHVIQRNPHKRPSDTPLLLPVDEILVKRTHRLWNQDSQSEGDEPSLHEKVQGVQASDDKRLGTVFDHSGTKLVSSLNRQQFTHFRLNPKRLKKQKYQILYFPMSAPLTDEEKIQAKVVTSRKIG